MKSNQVTNQLNGQNNKKRRADSPVAAESTAAWADYEKVIKDSGVRIPSEEGVENAKEWVDNGSKL